VAGRLVRVAARVGVDALSVAIGERAPTVGGLLLTGGSSRRLGTDKATVVVGGQRLADHAAAVLTAVCATVLEVGPGVTDLPVCREDPVGSGPLAALVAGFAALGSHSERGVILLACDLPGVEVPLVDLVARWTGRPTVVPLAGGEPQVVCARYGADALDAAVAAIGAGERSLRALLDRVEHDRIEPSTWGAVAPADAFADVDTPADLARARTIHDPTTGRVE
jgi:molybdopterin-guanine dinucleotide biosynthesis protein A